jgi:glycerol-3-phosphate acyltransferase PlsY
MNHILTYVIYILITYLLGGFPTSAVIARLVGGLDLSKTGSGNLGATNVARVIGKKFGIITLAVDALKGFIPVYIAFKYYKFFHFSFLILSIIMIAPIIGHCYSIYIKFKGGKGVATALGVFAAISPEAVLMALLIFIVMVFLSRYVSLSSITAAFFMPFLVFYNLRNIDFFIASCFISLLIIFKHIPNITRLLNGTENKINKKKQL